MNIKEFSQRTGLSMYTLRYYEKIGLVRIRRDSRGHRTYSVQDLKWVKCLKRLKNTGMPLKDLKEFAGLRHVCTGIDCDRLKILECHQNRLEKKRNDLLRCLGEIEEEITRFKVWNKLN